MCKRFSITGLILGVFAALHLPLSLGSSPEATESPAVPRYKLETGQELVFENTLVMKSESNSSTYHTTTTLWVVGRNDGDDAGAGESWDVVTLQAATYSSDRRPDTDPRYTVQRGKLHADGRFELPKPDSSGSNLDLMFPLLPPDAAALDADWKREGDFGSVTRYTAVAGEDPNVFIFESSREGIEQKIYETTWKATSHFDRTRGLTTSLEGTHSQKYGFNNTGTIKGELVSVEMKSPEEVAGLVKDFDAYFAAAETYEAETHAAAEDATTSTAHLDTAAGALRAAAGAVQSQELRQIIDKRLASHERMGEYYKQRAADRAKLINAAAAEWDTTDFTGKQHSLAAYRGQVVVLDFWYRGCGWCIRAMPQVKQLADDFGGQPVAILGMNTDQNEADAHFVIDTMELNYPNLRATGIPEKYSVQGFPTLIIIDQRGNVRDIHVGYSPDLRDTVAATIRKLIEESPDSAAGPAADVVEPDVK